MFKEISYFIIDKKQNIISDCDINSSFSKIEIQNIVHNWIYYNKIPDNCIILQIFYNCNLFVISKIDLPKNTIRILDTYIIPKLNREISKILNKEPTNE